MISKNLKKRILATLTAVVIAGTLPITAFAASETINCKGTSVYWEYGRRWSVYSYSKVQSSVFQHSATANSTFSGWKEPGIVAEASEFVGSGTARAYWNCR